MRTYLFYDIETTGLNKSFDQVLQFAAIRTDLTLKELERYEIKIKLNPDVIPAPKAIITHQIGIQDALQGVSEIEAILQIHRLMNEPGTTSLGYNTLEFDDEFLRFSFYRNLLTPYTHQYANQCSRLDIYPITVMYFLFKNEVLNWPQKNGKLSLKLEEINQANHLVSGRAHDAMVDVEATLELARIFIKEKDMWDYVLGYFNKQIDQTRSKMTDGLMIYNKFGSDQYFQSPVLFLGQHRHYNNQFIWLRLDSEKLINPSEEVIADFKLVVNKKHGEPGFILPLQDRYRQHLSSERHTLAENNKQWLLKNPEILQRFVNHHTEYKYPDHPADIEASLYRNGFWTFEEANFCKRFHEVSAAEKAKMTEKLPSSNLKLLATRLLGRHYSEALTEQQKGELENYRRRINPQDEKDSLIDFRGEKRLTPKLALNQIVEIRKNGQLSEIQTNLLFELEKYLTDDFV